MPPHRDREVAHEPTKETSKTHQLSVKRAVWEVFCEDHVLLRRHNVQPHELGALSRVAMLGSVRTKSDLIFMLNVIRRPRSR